MSEIILYDIPNKDSHSWSYNPWKTRLVLNFKGIPYKTEWVEYPDLAPTFKSLGIPPNEPPATAYSSPTIRISNNYVTDSRKIADVLEKEHPSPSLHLDSPTLKKVEELAPQCIWALAPVFVPRVPHIVNPPSAEYFERTRAARFGMPLSQWEKEKGGERAWNAAEPKWKELGTLLKAEGGPFFMGKTVSYADFIVVGALRGLFVVGGDQMLQQVTDIEPAYLTLYDASKAWLERDDR